MLASKKRLATKRDERRGSKREREGERERERERDRHLAMEVWDYLSSCMFIFPVITNEVNQNRTKLILLSAGEKARVFPTRDPFHPFVQKGTMCS